MTAFAKAALPLFAEGGGGSVVTLSYLGAERALPNYNVMESPRPRWRPASAIWLLAWAATTFASTRCRPGRLKLCPPRESAALEKFCSRWKSRRRSAANISAEEVAAAAVFLLSPLSSAITGEVIHADAGFHITAGLAEEE